MSNPLWMRLLSLFFGCSAHAYLGLAGHAVSVGPVRCQRRAFHEGAHQYPNFGPDQYVIRES